MLLRAKILFASSFWKYSFSFINLINSILSVVGFFHVVLNLVFPSSENMWMTLCLLMFVGFFVSLCLSFPKIAKYYRLKKNDVEIGFQIQNIFKIQGDKVVPTNTEFKMKIEKEGGVIDENSLQGKILKEYKIDGGNLESILNLG